jgi:hypothetical protein
VVTSGPLVKTLQPDETGSLDLILDNTCDVPVDFDLLALTAVTAPILMSEDFDSGVWLPDGWELPEPSDKPWRLSNTSGEVDGGTGYAAYMDFDLSEVRDDWLITPELDASSFTDLVLSFRAFSRTIFTGATVQVWVLDESGVELSTEPLWDMIRDEDWSTQIYRTVLVDLSQFAGEDVIRIGWRYKGVNGESFGLDTIEVGSPSDVPWLSLTLNRASTSGTIPAGGEEEITVGFNATGLAYGDYEALLFVRNGPYPVIDLPVRLSVRAEEDFLYYLPLITK